MSFKPSYLLFLVKSCDVLALKATPRNIQDIFTVITCVYTTNIHCHLESVSIFCSPDTKSFFLAFAEEHRHPRQAWFWDPDAGGSLQATAGLQQERAGPQRLQEPADL